MQYLNEQWDDSLRSKRYPFSGTGSIATAQGPVVPDDLFLDLNLMVAQETQVVSLVSITVNPAATQYRFELQDGTLVGLLTSTSSDTQLMPIQLGNLVVGYAKLDLGSAQIVRGWVPGLYTVNGTEVLPHLLVISDPKWRRGFQLPDGTILTGNVYLVADRGLWLERTTDGFRLHASGDPFDGRVTPARGLLTLNGIGPDQDGNLNLIGLSPSNFSGLTFVPAGSSFRINITPAPTGLTIDLTGAQ